MDKVIDELELARERVAKNIIGEIVLSSAPEKAIRKWRTIFKASQKEIAGKLGITSSVISDYESGRRKSPGIKVIKKYVNALLSLDTERGSEMISSFSRASESGPISPAIVDIREFSGGISVRDFCRAINAVQVVKGIPGHEIYGYTIIDSVRAITELSFSELIKLYGITTQRALVFTKVSTGRTPMVAIKMTNLRPGLVVLHGLNNVDSIAKSIAKAEGIPLALCRLEGVEGIIAGLKGLRV
jgi:putative transcriptional regulator